MDTNPRLVKLKKAANLAMFGAIADLISTILYMVIIDNPSGLSRLFFKVISPMCSIFFAITLIIFFNAMYNMYKDNK